MNRSRGSIDNIRLGPKPLPSQEEIDAATDRLLAAITEELKGEKQMSWSVMLIGTPEGVNKALDEYGESISGQSQEEFLEAKPHLQALVSQAVGEAKVRLNANGHATFTDGKKASGQCNVEIAAFYGKWCQ